MSSGHLGRASWAAVDRETTPHCSREQRAGPVSLGQRCHACDSPGPRRETMGPILYGLSPHGSTTLYQLSYRNRQIFSLTLGVTLFNIFYDEKSSERFPRSKTSPIPWFHFGACINPISFEHFGSRNMSWVHWLTWHSNRILLHPS